MLAWKAALCTQIPIEGAHAKRTVRPTLNCCSDAFCEEPRPPLKSAHSKRQAKQKLDEWGRHESWDLVSVNTVSFSSGSAVCWAPLNLLALAPASFPARFHFCRDQTSFFLVFHHCCCCLATRLCCSLESFVRSFATSTTIVSPHFLPSSP